MTSTATCHSKLLNHSADVNQLCSSLRKHLNVSYFNFVRLCEDSNRALLTNRAKYIDDFYKKKQQNDDTVASIERLELNQHFTWDMVAKTPAFSEASREYNIANGITIIKPYAKYTELYYFGTTRDNTQAPELYRSNIDMFERFILYFKDKGKSLIDEACSMPLHSDDNNNPVTENKLKSLNNQIITNFDRYRFAHPDNSLRTLFSKNESAFLMYYSLLFSKREIAKVIDVCENTVGYYLNKLQNQLHCYNKRDLLDRISRLHLIDLNDNTAINFQLYSHNKIINTNNQDFINKTKIKKIYLENSNNGIFLTKKEAVCLFHFCHGYSAKEIGRMMVCSYRTTEQHLYSIKKKLGIRKKSALTKYCLNHGIFDMITFAYPELVA